MTPKLQLVAGVVSCVSLLLSSASYSPVSGAEQQPSNGQCSVPPQESVPKGPLGDSIRLGRMIFTQTPKYASAYVGDQLSCTNCHLGAGTVPYASPMMGLLGLFPMFNPRANKVITFAERLEECFVRSENGKPLPYDGPEMTALIAYLQWLSQQQPIGTACVGRGLVKLPELRPDAEHGAVVYAQQCGACHGKNGAGMPPALPPVWGPGAYNDGAGINGIAKMAAFVQHNMPQNKPGSLSAQDAFDVAAFIRSKPHSVFNPAFSVY